MNPLDREDFQVWEGCLHKILTVVRIFESRRAWVPYGDAVPHPFVSNGIRPVWWYRCPAPIARQSRDMHDVPEASRALAMLSWEPETMGDCSRVWRSLAVPIP